MVGSSCPMGFAGKVLKVNLSSREIKIEDLPREAIRFIGGSGLATWFISKMVDPLIDPLNEKNVIVFCVGPVTGTSIPMSSRYVVASKSPLNGTLGDADAGGFWGPELKSAGFDAILVTGKSTKPVFLWICDGEAELKDARDLWGLDHQKTEEEVKRICGDCRLLSIGPAGENLVKFSVISNDGGRIAGRSGLGAVLGSKGLKAIVVKGEQRYSPTQDIVDLAKEIIGYLLERDGIKRLSKFGTGSFLENHLARGNLPLKNWGQDEWSEESAKRISSNRLSNWVKMKMGACKYCPVGCEKRIEYDGVEEKGPEYETIAALGSLCLVDDPMTIIKANRACNLLGIDTIETGTLMAFLMECFERKILSQEKVGVSLYWGSGDSFPELVEMIAFRHGFGNILAEGLKRAAELIGGDAPNFAMHVKGAPICMHDPRVQQDKGLNYATLPSGAYHGKGGSNFVGLPRSESLAGELVKRQNFAEIIDSLVMCSFAFEFWAGGLPVDFIPRILKTVSGLDLKLDDLDRIGGEIFGMKVAFARKSLGRDKIGDPLPERFKKVPRVRGGIAFTFQAENLLEEYYKCRSS
ncbi:MAG: aldehyde ferredoxin oxidoreductase family protein [Candidatus Hadarchaeum sp.]|uniref:aldehyde ferredoxin oxidoreductase family protein n=1 Tax=Candidatus Hadarchaeum sp. TaxID=2883567 RepID=UPI00317B0226